jgi:hypothetical protein
MPDPCRLSTLGTNQHRIRDVDRHGLVDHASLTRLALRTHMLLDNIQTFNDHLVNLWHGPRNRSSLSPILTRNDQDGVTLLDIHLGQVERLLLFLFCCHLLFIPLTLLVGAIPCGRLRASDVGGCLPGDFLVKALQAQAK